MEHGGSPERVVDASRPRMLELAVAFASLVPLVGLALLALTRLVLVRPAWRGARRWWLGWSLALAPLALLAVVHAIAAWHLPALLVTVLLFAAAAGLAVAPRRAVVVGGLLALCVMVAGLGIERLAAERTFYDRSVHPELDVRRWVSLVRDAERIDPRREGAGIDRAWRTATPIDSVVVRLEARLAPDTAERVADGADPPRVWLGVAPLAPSRASWQEQPLALNAHWQQLEVVLDHPSLVDADTFRSPLRIVGSGAVEVRGFTLRGPDDARLTPLPQHLRQRLWFGGPNLLGHVLSMTGVMVMATSPSLALAAGAGTLTIVGQVFTGSRTATAVFVIVAVWLLLLAVRPGRRWPVVTVLVALLAVVSLTLEPADLGRLGVWSLDDRNVLSRSVEMRDAWEAMLADPWRGAGEGGLPALAHNAWLQLAGEYGVPGAVAGVWWALAVLVLAARWGGLRGLLVGLAFLALQLTDESWRYPGVFLPMLLGVSALAAERRRPSAASGLEDAAP